MTTTPTVTPASTSARSSFHEYFGSQRSIGTRLVITRFAVAAEQHEREDAGTESEVNAAAESPERNRPSMGELVMNVLARRSTADGFGVPGASSSELSGSSSRGCSMRS